MLRPEKTRSCRLRIKQRGCCWSLTLCVQFEAVAIVLVVDLTRCKLGSDFRRTAQFKTLNKIVAACVPRIYSVRDSQ